VTFENDIYGVQVAKEGNVYDLKKAIAERTGVAAANQQLDGFAMPAHELTDDLPLLALDVDHMHPLLLRQFKPVIVSFACVLALD